MKNDLANDPLVVTTMLAAKGGVIGLVFGTAFFYVIAGLSMILPMVPGSQSGMPPVQIAMMAGSVFGAVFGGIVGLRKSR